MQAYLRDPDVQLMLRAKEGDEAAFTQLVLSYQDRLIAVFSHLLGDQDVAEDLVQDVFLRVYRARNGYQPTAKFSTWLYRIANNLANNSRRDRGRRREVPLPSTDTGPVGARSNSKAVAEKSGLMPSRLLQKSELCDVVREALAGLNERQRMAVLLNKFEEMSYADIGETMELSSAAVKSLLSRARDTLRDRLEQYVK
jgi:RNA polymerase sigma-70 factor, ECF subfamily